ncbi:MAG TPA: hypothetical protein VGD55_05725 [Acidothermaceae bacterium]
MPRVRFPLALLAAAVLLITGCASQTSTSARSVTSSPAPAPAGYACSTADLFTQPVDAAVDQHVTLGDTTAALTGTSESDGVEPTELRGGVLAITRAGDTTVALPITPPASSQIVDLFILETQSGRSNPDDETAGSLCLVRFSDGAAPVALIALTTGGAHCCITVRAVPIDGSPTLDRDFGNYGPWLRNVSSNASVVPATVPVMVTADNAFAYQFTSFAGSGPPVQLVSWTGTAFTDVTRRHLDVVRDDAQSYLAAYNDPTQPEKLGFLAGWVADECLAGDAGTAWTFYDQQWRLGHAIDVTDPAWAATANEAAMPQFVVAHGYCPASFGITASRASSPTK